MERRSPVHCRAGQHSMNLLPPLLPVIKSASDIGSAVAHRLCRAGLGPVLLEGPAPAATRRLMAFAGAVHEGRAELEGVTAVRCADVPEALALRLLPDRVPLLVAEGFEPLPEGLHPQIVVDARMRKRQAPPVQLHEAALVIGIGPGFEAGVHAHAVIESNWGEHLGQVLWQGRSEEYTGRHREIGGKGRERYLYAPHAGRFETARDLLQPVQPGDVVGTVDGTPLPAQAAGILRGLATSGLQVPAGAKLAEIDPTGDPANSRGIGQRQGAIADGVLAAIRARWPELGHPSSSR